MQPDWETILSFRRRIFAFDGDEPTGCEDSAGWERYTVWSLRCTEIPTSVTEGIVLNLYTAVVI